MRWGIILAALCAARSASAFEPPSKLDLVLLSTATALIVVDSAQSMGIKNHARMAETEPAMVAVFGNHPTDLQFVLAGGIGIVGMGAVWAILPPRWRWLAPAVVAVTEGIFVAHNARLGLTLGF